MEKSKGKQTIQRISLPKLSSHEIFAMTFGFLGVNMAFSLQTSQMGRIFQTLGVRSDELGLFFILPPISCVIALPLIGKLSDNTWNRWGRRIPYLLIFSPLVALAMALLPNSGQLLPNQPTAFTFIVGACLIMIMDLSCNVCMQPYEMLISDMVNDKQKNKAWSWQQAFSNIGGIVASILPFFLAQAGLSNIASRGELPSSLKWAFYMGAIVIMITTIYTYYNVREYSPDEYQRYHGKQIRKKKPSISSLMINAPKVFWEISLIQLLSWFAFQYLWTYATGTIAHNIWNTIDSASSGYQYAGNWYGVLTCIQSLAAVAWGLLVISHTGATYRRLWLSIGLLLGGIGFVWLAFSRNKWTVIVPFIMIGIAYLTLQTQSFAIFTAEIRAVNGGIYLGLLNSIICLSQALASVSTIWVYPLTGGTMGGMIILAGISLILGGIVAAIMQVIKHKQPKLN